MFNKYGAMDELGNFVADDFRRMVESFVQREIDTHAVDIHDLSFIMHQTLDGVFSERILMDACRMKKEERQKEARWAEKLAYIMANGTPPTEELTE
jgi:hypothetical protein